MPGAHGPGRVAESEAPAVRVPQEKSTGSFDTFGLSKQVLRAVAELGFVHPRPIQAKTIPAGLLGRDILGLAQTGTGKTAAFALPIIERILASREPGPRALILSPTRELALQTQAEIEQLAKYTNVRSITIFGGVGAPPQVRAMRSRPDIVVACPGRLLDLMGSRDARFDNLEVLVLDEADHMLDMGFLPDIKRILAQLPKRRQNLLFSATMPREIRRLTDGLLTDPHVVELGHSAPAETVEHALYPVTQGRKAALLRHLLDDPEFRSAIVFLRTKHRARRLAQDLDRAGHRAVALQGNMNQGQRQRAMQGFRDGQFDVLVATDIAARGIDVAQVSHVINFDLPNTPDAYTHRIGRTGRSERSGKAYTFVTHEDAEGIRAIERKLQMEIPRILLREFQSGEGENTFARGAFERPGSERKSTAGRNSSSRSSGKPAGKGPRGRSSGPKGSGGRPAGGTGGRGARPAGNAQPAARRTSDTRPAAAPARSQTKPAPGPSFGVGL